MQYSQRDFFHTVLSSEGKPCVARLIKAGSGRGKFAHDVYDSIEEMCEALDITDFTQTNYYFAISTLDKPFITEKAADGKETRRVRVQTNTLKSRVFVLDIDIRDKEGHYRTKEDGLEGLQRVVESFNMPQPIVVDSGFGYHVYWPMAEGVASDIWRKTAAKFKQAIAVIAPEVVADGSRVADSAGVLRIPGSFNLKGDPLAPVVIHQWYSDFLDFGEFDKLLDRITGKTVGSVKTNIGATSYAESKPGDLAKVTKNCNWVKEYIKNRADASEPEWYAILGLVPFMEARNGSKIIKDNDLAHVISRGHPQYDEEATYKKYMQAKGAQTGPTTCARLQSINSKRCEGCPFAGTVKTPIAVAELQREVTEAKEVVATVVDDKGERQEEKITIPLPPKPYFRGEDGGVFVRVKEQQADGAWAEVIKKVYDYDIYPTRRLRTELLESESMEIHAWLPKDGLRKFRLPTSQLAENKALAKFIADKGIIPEFGKLPMLSKYLTDYVRYMQTQYAAETEFSRYGWRGANSAEPKFVIGEGYIDHTGNAVSSTHADFLHDAAKAVKTAGLLDSWKEGFMVYEGVPNAEPFILAALVGFAAPLMAFTPYSGVLYNLVGHSSAGKSTAMQVMTSVFGQPTASHIMKSDTDISMYNFIGYLNSIPVAYDELTNLDGERLSDFCLNFTIGRGKMRAMQNGQNKINLTEWGTIVVASSNTSLYEKLAANRKGYNAEAMRIFEVNVPEPDKKFAPHIDKCIKQLKGNHGIAGREYVSYVIKNIPKVKQLIEQATAAINAKGNLRNEERFWGALLACVLVGGKISRDVLKLHNYNVEGIIKWALGLSSEVRENIETSTSDPTSLLAEFINSNLNSMIKVNTKEGKQTVTSLQSNLMGVKARLEYEEDEIQRGFISVPAMRDYCFSRKIDSSWLRQQLVAHNIIDATPRQVRLTAGTTLPMVNVRCWQVNMKHEKLAAVVDIAEPEAVTVVSKE